MNTQTDLDSTREPINFIKKHILQHNQEINNPCLKEHMLSLRCLDSNQEKRNTCEMYFINYKNCKDFWASVQVERRRKAIKPYLPPIEERAKIKADFFNSK